MDLLALAELMATLRDWLVICQSRVPVVWVLMYLVTMGIPYSGESQPEDRASACRL